MNQLKIINLEFLDGELKYNNELAGGASVAGAAVGAVDGKVTAQLIVTPRGYSAAGATAGATAGAAAGAASPGSGAKVNVSVFVGTRTR